VAEPEDNRKQLATNWDNSEQKSNTDVTDQNDSQASPADVAEPKDDRKQLAPTCNWDNSEHKSGTDVTDQNDQAIPNSPQLSPSDVLTRLQQFSFSPVKRLAELSFNTLRTHPFSFA
jgi:hypothetical protein